MLRFDFAAPPYGVQWWVTKIILNFVLPKVHVYIKGSFGRPRADHRETNIFSYYVNGEDDDGFIYFFYLKKWLHYFYYKSTMFYINTHSSLLTLISQTIKRYSTYPLTLPETTWTDVVEMMFGCRVYEPTRWNINTVRRRTISPILLCSGNFHFVGIHYYFGLRWNHCHSLHRHLHRSYAS